MHEVKAAGCLVRCGADVAVIHRPEYDDWTFPKGKLDPGETFEQAAVREVREEIGVDGELGDELPSSEYHDHRGRFKLVRYWLMDIAQPPPFEPNEEVDEVRWLPIDRARELLSYDRDRELLT